MREKTWVAMHVIHTRKKKKKIDNAVCFGYNNIIISVGDNTHAMHNFIQGNQGGGSEV